MSCHVVADLQRVLTVSRKSERLVNLTIALLATKRYLTKSEIFKSVAGYSGDSEAKDRMFERDKDDLRSLGIVIELGSFDPLFDDEAGYRIKPESYALQLQDLDPTDIALLSEASQLWREAALGDAAQTGLRKLKALGVDSDIDSIIEITPQVHATPEQLPDLIEAISDRRRVTFEYFDENLNSNVRSIEPYRLSNARGYWYLVGRDIDKDSFRTFRLDRLASAVTFKGSAGAFEINSEAVDIEEADYLDSTMSATIALRKGKGAHLRNSGVVTELDAEWDSLEIQYHSEESILKEVFWLGENAYVIAPESLRNSTIDRLLKAVALHG
jgi:proteasome accessory factor B